MVAPVGVALDSAGEVFSSETVFNDIRKVVGTGLASTPTPYFRSPLFSGPRGVALDTIGSVLYVADQTSNTVKALNLGNNVTTNWLGVVNGMSRPVDVAVDLGDNVYVLNQGTGGNGGVLAFDHFGNALGAVAAGLAKPAALKLDAYGSVFVAEQGGMIQQFSGGVSNVVAVVTNAGVQLAGLALFDDGTIAVSDAGNHVIWQVDPVTRAVSLLTGALGVPGSTLGSAGYARLNQPQQLARAAGNLLVAADYGNNRLVVIDRTGAVTNVLNSTNAVVWYGRSGDPHGSSDPQFAPMLAPLGVALNSAGEVFSSETVYNDIRKVTGTGLGWTAVPYFRSPLFGSPRGVALNTVGSVVYVADQGSNTVKALNLGNNVTTNWLGVVNGMSRPVDVAVDLSDNVYVLNQGTGGNGSILAFDHFGNPLGTVVSNLTKPTAFKNVYGGFFVAEQDGAIQHFISGTSNTIVTITNAGVQLQGLALFDDGTIAVSDAGNHVIWQVNPVTRVVSLLTGAVGVPGSTLGAANFARLNQPQQLGRAGDDLLVAADYGNNRLVVIDRSGAVTNVLNWTNSLVWYGRTGDPHGTADPQFAPMLAPVGVVLSGAGEVFASEASNNDIRKLLGTGLAGPSPSYFPPSLFNGPQGLALNSAGSLLYIADQTNNAIQALNLANNLTTTFLSAGDGISRPVDVAIDYRDNLYVLNQGTNGNGSIEEFDRFGNFLGAIARNLAKPTAFCLQGSADFFVAEQDGAIQQFSPGSSNTLATITTPGVQLQGIALFDDGTIVVSDAGNHVIWQVSPVTNAITLLTGSVGVPGSTLGATNFARLNQPQQLARAVGNLLVAADYGNNRLVVIDRSGSITKVLDSTNALVWYGRTGDPHANSDPQFAPMALPTGLALNNAGDVFVSEALYDDIRKLVGTGLTAPPGTPTILTVFTNYGQVGLTWSASANATGYNVKRSPSSLGPYTTIASTSSTNYTDTSVLNGTTYYYVVSATGDGSESPNSDPVSATTPLPPVPDPVIGYVDFPPPYYLSVLHPVSSAIFNNDVPIVIKEDAGCQLYYTNGPTGDNIPDPTSASASAPVGYQDGLSSSETAFYSINLTLPDLTIKAIGEKADGSPNSAIVQARFQFITANPAISGLNFHNFTISEVTANANLSYTLDGTDPSYTNGFDLSTTATLTASNLWTVQFNSPIESNILFKVVALRNNYQPSRVISQWFYPSNAIANWITPNSGYYPMGQTITVVSSNSNVYYTGDGSEPTTNSLPVFITNHVGYIRWFNSTNDLTGLRVKVFATGGGQELTGQPVSTSTIGVPPDVNPAINAGIGAQIVVPVVVNLQSNVAIQSCQFRVEISPNASAQPISSGGFDLLNLGAGPSDFIPLRWPVLGGSLGSITTSNYTVGSTSGMEIAALGPGAMSFTNFAVVALLRIAIPDGASEGDSYALAVRYPSATADGLSDSVPLTPMAPATILVTNVAYTVGDSAAMSGGWSVSGGWYNAGGFGDGNLDNSDVNLAFVAAVGLRVPYAFSDVFNAMDAYPVDAAGFVGGDGVIRFLDWNVILQRALRLDTNNWARAWSVGGNLVDVPTTLTISKKRVEVTRHKLAPAWPWYRQALVGAESVGNAVPGGKVNLPVYVKLADGAALSGVQFRAVVTPQGGAPSLTQAPQFSPDSGVPGPTLQQNVKASDTGFGWALGSFNYLSRSSNFLGWVTFTIPATAQSGQTYSVSFANADGAPNLSVQYDFETRSACVAVGGSAPPASICSDEWKVHFFGSLTNPSAGDLADPDGDGAPNWMEYLAGTDPTDPKSRLQLSGSATQAGKAQSQMTIHWLTAPGKAYEVQWSSSLSGGSWSTLATVSGDGTVASCSDTNITATVRYYRLHVLP
jgi:VCBS repeat-containing protein